MTIRILIAADVGSSLLDRVHVDPRFDVRYQPVRDSDELIRLIGDAEVLVTRHHNRVGREVLEAGRNLRAIAQGTSGLDNIDLDVAAARGIAVIGLPGENANAVAELAISHMIALTRRVGAYDAMVRRGEWERDGCVHLCEMRSHKLGIVGLGRVGGRVARLAGMLGTSVDAYDPYITPEVAVDRGAVLADSLESLLRASTILSLHVPLTDETRRMIGGKELDLLPEGAVVINTSRGPVLDQEGLFERLESGRIGGAALDVYDSEPPAGVQWPVTDQLILTPHIAGCSRESKRSIGALLYEKICEFFGLDPATPTDRFRRT